MEDYENKELYPEEPVARPEADAQPDEVVQPESVSQPEPEVQPESVSQQPAWQIPPVSQPYSGIGVGRKKSPFADSPYVMNHQQNQTNSHANTYVPPVPPQKPAKPKKTKNSKGGKIWKKILSVAAALAVVVGSCAVTASVVNNRWETEMDHMYRDMYDRLNEMQEQIEANAQAAANAAAGNSVSGTVATGEALTPGQVYAKNVQSVVLISCTVKTSAYGQEYSGYSTGSGFFLTENGYVVTNAHVVEGASDITVTTFSGENMAAKLVGTDATNDVAVLKVEGEGLPAVTIGSSEDLIVGDQVVAIGNPLGELTSTMTVGYVSGKNRDVTTEGNTINMIQTDAAINSGNSGGPLFNMKGEVVGITTAKYSGASASGATIEGIGFAIPIDDVIGMVGDLKDYGYVTGAYLGVMVTNLDAQTAGLYRLPVGAYIIEITPGYCAEKAGLEAGDIIVALGGYDVDNVTDLTRALRKYKAGDTTQITVFRRGAEVVLTITLDEKPADTGTTVPSDGEKEKMPENGSYEEWYDYFFGNRG